IRRQGRAKVSVMLVAGRNSPCPCGSGKKYKRCCEAKEAEMRESLLPAGRFRYEFGSYGGPSDMTHK
ncbi:MAG: SEC-C metal-binding domain-containing protein, partial [Dehalococcoidia bacterium]